MEGYKPLIPIMTSNTTPKGACLRSSVYNASREAFKAFNGTNNDTVDSWSSSYADGNSGNAYIGYDFEQFVKVNRLEIHARNDANSTAINTSIRYFDLEGWNGITWEIIGSYDIGEPYQARVTFVEIINNKSFSKYRLNKARPHLGSYGVAVGTIQMYEKENKAYLINVNNNYLYTNINDNWQNIGQLPADPILQKQLFEEHGMDDITGEQIEQLKSMLLDKKIKVLSAKIYQ